MSAVCNVTHAISYSSECAVSACNTGWKVSDDQSKCQANVCLCPNGVAPSDGACTVDRATVCQSCGSGFELTDDEKACDGTLPELVV